MAKPRIYLFNVLALVAMPVTLAFAQAKAENPADAAVKIVAEIRAADYAGDRPKLRELYDQLTAPSDNPHLGSRIRYWRGFAMWRSALNGFNDSDDKKTLEVELNEAVNEFDLAARQDPDFADAKIAESSCLMNLLFLHQKDQDQVQAYLIRAIPLMNETKKTAPDNPRWYWVYGPNAWSLSVAQGGGQDKAFEAYNKGLDLIRKQKATDDPLEPNWGEPELLMNLAWSNLHRTSPDLKAADQYAHDALALAPTWHYVRDILLPQIQQAEKKPA